MRDKILGAIIEKIKRNYVNDIAILAIYGSYVRGDTYKKSDIDFYFIPKTIKGENLKTGFILDDIGYDLWPMSWERLESLAEYRGMVSLIADAKVVFYDCDTDLKKFTDLQKKVKSPSDVDFNGEASKIIGVCKQYFFDIISSSDLSLRKTIAVRIIEELVFAIALINRTYTRLGWGKSIDEVSKMTLVPQQFAELCEMVICSETGAAIEDHIRLLINRTEEILVQNQSPCDFQREFSMFYEEAKSLYNKLCNACDTEDRVTASMAGASLQREILSILGMEEYKRAGFPDIVFAFHRDRLPDYKETVLRHEQCLVELLHRNRVKINIYRTFYEFKKDFIEA